MELKKVIKNTLFTICLFVVCKNYAQHQTAENPVIISNNDTLVYMLLGDGCPFCNIYHPEKKFGFTIECVGCMETKKITENNIRVSRILNLKYGRGWLEKYLQEYKKCEKYRPRVVTLPYYLTLNIETHYQLDSVRMFEVFDSKGISVLKGKDNTVDVSSLEKGSYYLVLDETEMKEFIKK